MAAGLLALCAAASPPHKAYASKGQFTIFDASQELVGDQCCGALTSQAVDDAKGLGADTVRVLVFWRDIVAQPDSTTKPPGDSGDPAWQGYAQSTTPTGPG